MNEQTSDWQPIKTEDIPKLYREGWSLRLDHCTWTINRRAEPGDLLPASCLLRDNWVGKPPEKKWEVVERGMSFLAAMHWLESAQDGMRRLRRAGFLIEIVAHQGMPCWVHQGEADNACVFDAVLVTATDWEGLEVEK